VELVRIYDLSFDVTDLQIDASEWQTLESMFGVVPFRWFGSPMPLYEYECRKCHHRFERLQKFSDPHVKKCPDCGGPVEQVISAPAVQFKGSGWYVTDYAKKSSTASSSSNGDSAAKDSASKKGEKKESTPKSEASSKKADNPGKKS
jgi:putative FmdB family regulatory protein